MAGSLSFPSQTCFFCDFHIFIYRFKEDEMEMVIKVAANTV
jgi:hypothetical protein